MNVGLRILFQKDNWIILLLGCMSKKVLGCLLGWPEPRGMLTSVLSSSSDFECRCIYEGMGWSISSLLYSETGSKSLCGKLIVRSTCLYCGLTRTQGSKIWGWLGMIPLSTRHTLWLWNCTCSNSFSGSQSLGNRY